MGSSPAPQPNVNLSSGQLSDKISAAAGASVIMQTYAQTVLNQAIINGLTALPNLPNHQNSAIQHATFWQNTLLPQVVQIQDDINGFCNNFLSYYNPLLSLAQQIVAGDTTKVATFNEGLQELEKIVNTNETSAGTVHDNLTTFDTDDLSPDVRNFSSDYSTASTKILGDNGTLTKLNLELDAVNSAISKDTMMIAFGATGAVVGVLVICVGALGEFETAGLSTGLVVAGVAILAGGTAAAGIGGKDLVDQNNRYSDLTTQINQINSEVTALTTVKGQIEGLLTALQNAEQAVSAVAQEWSTVKANFVTLQTQLTQNVNTVSPFLVQQLQAAQADWTNLQTHVQQLESFKSVPTTNQTVAQAMQKAA